MRILEARFASRLRAASERRRSEARDVAVRPAPRGTARVDAMQRVAMAFVRPTFGADVECVARGKLSASSDSKVPAWIQYPIELRGELV